MIIVIQCKDRVGLVAAISGLLAAEQINIVSMREHVDTVEERFFARLQVAKQFDAARLQQKLQNVLPAGAQAHVNPQPEKKTGGAGYEGIPLFKRCACAQPL